MPSACQPPYESTAKRERKQRERSAARRCRERAYQQSVPAKAMCAQPESVRGNAKREIDVQAKALTPAARDAVKHVKEFGVPAPEEVIALGEGDDVLRRSAEQRSEKLAVARAESS